MVRGMKILRHILVGFIAVEHIGFLVLEMFLWTKPIGMKVFKLTPEVAFQTATLASNQGLYNGFLAAGLLWSFFAAKGQRQSLRVFFLSCVAIAGLYGWYSVSQTVLFVQALPAALALVVCRYQSEG